MNHRLRPLSRLACVCFSIAVPRNRNARPRVLPGRVTGPSVIVFQRSAGDAHSRLLLDPPSSPLHHAADEDADADIALSGRADGDGNRQARASPWPGGVLAANPATRMNAVAPTATAPTIEKTICQASEGMACFTTPCVA